eukprot:9681250-Ditylum_brightwellii.AAC.1
MTLPISGNVCYLTDIKSSVHGGPEPSCNTSPCSEDHHTTEDRVRVKPRATSRARPPTSSRSQLP